MKLRTKLNQKLRDVLFHANDETSTNLRRELTSESDFNAVLKREQARADRTGQIFTELVFDCKSLDAATTRRLWQAIRRRVRCTDEVGWLPESRIGIVLPDTPALGAWHLANDLSKLTRIPLHALACKVYIYPLEHSNEAGS